MTTLTVQVRSGGFTGPRPTLDSISQALDTALDMLPLSRVIMGWAPDREVYKQIAEQLSSRGVELYLWLPVFSEIGELRPCSPVLDRAGHSTTPIHLDDTENFEFYCPTDPANIQACLDIFDEHFDATQFDGVFLDKIRYPSLANGPLGCFCPRCLDIYQEAGCDFSDDNSPELLSLRCKLIADALGAICQAFRARGMRIGLDVFAPVISRSVGQDIVALSQLADFIKPMMYAITNAPAGLPFELAALADTTDVGGDLQDYCDLEFCACQVADLQLESACPIHPGIEINHIPGIAETSPDYIRRCLDTYAGSEGIVLSWNLLDMPVEHLAAVRANQR